jgi:hypothetical protein
MASDEKEKCGTKPIPFSLRDRLGELRGALLPVWLNYFLRADCSGYAWPSVWRLHLETGISEDWISRAKRELVALGWLVECGGQERKAGARFGSKKYIVAIPPCPTISGTDKDGTG